MRIPKSVFHRNLNIQSILPKKGFVVSSWRSKSLATLVRDTCDPSRFPAEDFQILRKILSIFGQRLGALEDRECQASGEKPELEVPSTRGEGHLALKGSPCFFFEYKHYFLFFWVGGGHGKPRIWEFGSPW